MNFGISTFLMIFGSLCFFIFGMKMMSDGIQRAAGSQLRNILKSMTKNRFLGIFTGFITTGIVQSSSATTVMTVSFVNAGLLTLVESAGVIMGANVGTTITGWIVSILGFKVKLSAYSIPLFGIGVPFLFSNRGKLKYWGEFIIGFSLLFLGLTYLKESVPDINSRPELLAFLQNFTEWGFFSRLFFVFVGAILTIIVQSSSAAMAITLTMCTQGWLPFEIGAAMILGENIGTTLTAEIAALVGNTEAKRAARIHSMFNLIGVGWMIVLMPFLLPLLAKFVEQVLGYANPFISTLDMPIGLSAFHTAFNILNMLLFAAFTGVLVNVAKRTVKGNPEDEGARLRFISTVTRTPELAMDELQKVTAHFGMITSRMASFTSKLINTTDPKEQNKLLKKLKKYEGITDNMEMEIASYISKLTNQEMTDETSLKVRSILNVCNDLERIGDIYYQISKTLAQKIENRIFFTPDQRNNINEMSKLIDKAFAEMNRNLNSNYQKVSKTSASLIEKEINNLKDRLKEHNLSRFGEVDYNVKSAMMYTALFTLMEELANHIYNITEYLVGEA